ncbi:MAG TPA: cobalamin-binding protein [Burkholderiaceae bacterium]|nr:cobalamin-binding protein [Burkholderiaceae bacterium]
MIRAACAALLLFCASASAELRAIDDTGNTVVLLQPAQRIVSLAPHITEQLFAIGAGERIVATTEYADYPAAAQKIPRVARINNVDLERVAAARPDLIIIWGSGFSPAVVEALKRLGPPVYVNEPGAIESIATSIERLGVLVGHPEANVVAANFRSRIAALRTQYAQRKQIGVFYQIWSEPLMTLGGRHVLSEAIRVCGGRNVFEELAPIAPQVSKEAVVAARPEIIVTAEPDARPSDALEIWRRFPQIPAVAHDQLVTLDANRINRHTPRMVEELALLCARIDAARTAAK